MRTTTLALVFIVLAISSTIEASKKKGKFFHEFENMKKSEFGQNLFTTLQVQLTSTSLNALGTVKTLLLEMLQGLQKDAQSEDERYAEVWSECDAEMNHLLNKIAQWTEDTADIKESLQFKTEEIQYDNTELEEKLQLQDKIESDIKALAHQREKEKEYFEDNLLNFAGLRTTFKQVQDLIRSLVDPNGETTVERRFGDDDEEEDSFLQITASTSIIKKTVSKIRKAVKSVEIKDKYSQGLHNILDVATSLLERNVDGKLLEQLIDILDQLIAKYEDLDQVARENEVDAQKRFEQRRTILNDLLYSTKSDIALYQGRQNDLENSILTLQNDLNSISTNIAQSQQEQQDLDTSCRGEKKAYEDTSSNRNGAIEILQKTLNILENGGYDELVDYVGDE
jgi:hypothetical protein